MEDFHSLNAACPNDQDKADFDLGISDVDRGLPGGTLARDFSFLQSFAVYRDGLFKLSFLDKYTLCLSLLLNHWSWPDT